jgi:hypothetical protein
VKEEQGPEGEAKGIVTSDAEAADHHG